jgi:enoyl-CoA hydratase/carnithine racemase
MITQKIPRWTGAVVLAVLGVVALALFLMAWLSANQIRSNLLLPVADERPYDIEILRTPPARLVIAGTDELGEAAMADAVRFAAGPTAAYAAVQRAVAGGLGVSLERGLEIEAAQFAGVFETDDARAGVAAFLAKGKPDFTGQ